MTRDWTIERRKIDASIKKNGSRALLRRRGIADRYCSIFISDWSAMERLNRRLDPADVLCLFSALDPDTGLPLELPPVRDLDTLFTLVRDDTGKPVVPYQTDEQFRFYAPVSPEKPANVVLYYEGQVRKY